MNGVNRVFLVGNLTRDGELKYTNNQKAVNSFGLAINEGKDRVTFLDVNLWGKVAESLKPYLVKGKMVAVIGRIEINQWEKDGVKRSKPVINANEIQLLGGVDKQDSNYIAQENEAPF